MFVLRVYVGVTAADTGNYPPFSWRNWSYKFAGYGGIFPEIENILNWHKYIHRGVAGGEPFTWPIRFDPRAPAADAGNL